MPVDMPLQWLGEGLEMAPVAEYLFDPSRRFRFDYAWPELKLAVEIDGGTDGVTPKDKFGRPVGEKHAGRHNSAEGYAGDCIKLNRAVELGWRVLRYTTRQSLLPESIEQVVRCVSDELVVRQLRRVGIGREL